MTEVLTASTSDDIISHYLADERPAHASRPWITLGMIASFDGSATLGVGSSGLGGPPDRAVFRALRAMSDLIVVGATTLNTEGYRAVSLPENLRSWRERRGMTSVPGVAIVSKTLELDMSDSLLASRPTILTCHSAPDDRRAALASVAEIVVAGQADVDVEAAMTELAARGVERVVLEGGPTLNGHMSALIDEVCMTVAPFLVGGGGPRIVTGGGAVRRATLARVIHSEDFLLLRYLLG
ncbi:MAG: dihydrofolate reductase family protein [Acidimicrobiia bacterium]